MARALKSASDHALMLLAVAAGAAGANFTPIGNVFLQNSKVLVINLGNFVFTETAVPFPLELLLATFFCIAFLCHRCPFVSYGAAELLTPMSLDVYFRDLGLACNGVA